MAVDSINRKLSDAWKHMQQRCNDSNYSYYNRYGGRGIKVCERWYDIKNFKIDMKSTCKLELTLERIDNEGNYCPENCTWVSVKEQANNRSTNRLISYNGRKMTVAQWSDFTGLKSNTIRQRLDYYNWSLDRCFGGYFG